MWIVRIALQRPYTFIVMALLIVLATPLVLLRIATDVLPEINIPVISVIWTYTGMSAQEMAQRVTGPNERLLATTVNDVEHFESQSYAGIVIIKLFLQPKASVEAALAQIASTEGGALRQLPPGITPPLVIRYTASAIPVVQLGISSASLPEQVMFDTAVNTLRPRLVSIPGVALPFPYGGKSRVVSVDLDLPALQAKGLAPLDVVNAINAQNLILPGGTAKIGATEFAVKMNGSTRSVEELNDLPVRLGSGAAVYLRDVAVVRDGFSPQTNIVRQDGKRGVIQSVLKNGGASTLQIVDNLRTALVDALPSLPEDIRVTPLFDQSVFVRAAIGGVVHEGLIAACLTAAMILLFLGNWRTTCIVAISIPLSVLASILTLYALGETINIMTLGGLALAVGILVDDATVTIENIERYLHLGHDLETAILEGAGEIAVPALVSTLCICIVFVPMFFLTGVARYLFVPLAEAVIFAMLASYLLSRTLVPTLALLFMKGQHGGGAGGWLQPLYTRFDAAFERLRGGYIVLLSVLLPRRRRFIAAFLAVCALSMGLYAVLGRDFFPAVDAGIVRLHFRAPSGTRIEETARLADRIEAALRELIPADQITTLVDNLGLPNSGINLSYSNAGTIGTLDGEIQVALAPGHGSSANLVERLRDALPPRFPGIEFFFQPADVVTQILNFGLPAAIDVQISGLRMAENYRVAAQLEKAVRRIPGAVDVHIHQRFDLPTVNLAMDRNRLQQLGLSAANVAQNVLIPLSGSFQTAPSFWLNPRNGVSYNITVQSPQYRIDSLDSLLQIPVAGSAGTPGQLLSNLVQVGSGREPAIVSRYNIEPAVDLYVSVHGRDLGAVVADVEREVEAVRGLLPKGSRISLQGQARTMNSSFIGLGIGVVMAVVLVYLLIVVNFQSWVDAFIIITALPAALAGIAWMLFLTGTPLSVPALTGAIMTVGVATANSILVVSFARQRLLAGAPPLSAALEAGATRLRPVLMTALAMIMGMLPMAIGLGEGGEQNAPLGRAVIGGLLWATLSTLVFVPLVFAAVHRGFARRTARRAALAGSI